jgi:hypothetical protein
MCEGKRGQALEMNKGESSSTGVRSRCQRLASRGPAFQSRGASSIRVNQGSGERCRRALGDFYVCAGAGGCGMCAFHAIRHCSHPHVK